MQTLSTSEVRDFAIRAHGDQKYAGQPYVYHLDKVVDVLIDCGYSHSRWVNAGLCHDVIEDCYQDHSVAWRLRLVQQKIGVDGGELVWSVTGIGPNRKARNADIYRKLGAHRDGCVIKGGDRVGSLEAAIVDPLSGKPNIPMAKMYLKEEETFMIVVGPHINEALRNRLKAAFAKLRQIVAEYEESRLD